MGICHAAAEEIKKEKLPALPVDEQQHAPTRTLDGWIDACLMTTGQPSDDSEDSGS